jgi:glycosyltransferase involved in cell wall biosynthesis
LASCQEDKRIYVLTETMDRPDVLGLIDCCDAYVSLHRAEGFGRTIAEAMQLGKPVIATNYSGNVDFKNKSQYFLINYELTEVEIFSYQWVEESDLANWANPKIENAAESFVKKPIGRAVKNNNEVGLYFSIKEIAKTLKNKLN